LVGILFLQTAGPASGNLPAYVDEYVVPTLNSAPLAISVDKRGLVWFTESNASKIGVYDPKAESFREYVVPGVGDMWGIAADASDSIWFTQYAGKGSVNPGGSIVPGGQGRIGRFDPSTMNFTFVDVPTDGSFPMRLVSDSQGKLWFTEFLGNKVGVYDPATASLSEYQVPTEQAGVADLAFDSHGRLWFTEAYARKVGSFDPVSKTFREYPTGPGVLLAVSPVGISVDESGYVWVADHGGNWVIRFDPRSEQVVRYPTAFPPASVYGISIPNGLLIDKAGRIWFTEHGGNSIGYVSPDGSMMVEFPIPTGPISTALWIALAPDGNVWFTEWSTNRIGVVHASLPPASLRVSEPSISLRAGQSTSLSLLTKSREDIQGNVTLRYTWSSYNPKDAAVTFSPPYPDLSGMADKPISAGVSVASTVRPGNYTLGVGIDAGVVRVWTYVQTSVTPGEQARTPTPTPAPLGLIFGGLLIAAGLVLFFVRFKPKRRP